MSAEPAPVEVSVVLPCLNEAETIEVCVRKALAGLAALGVVGEVLVADNGSTDGSQALAAAAGATVVHAPVRGYGGALIRGIEAARGRYVVMGDADDSYDLGNLGPFIAELRTGTDVVMGNRFKGGIAPGAMPPLHRYLGNPLLSWLGRLLFRLPGVGDFHCGLRGFNRDRIRALGLCMAGMEFASELVIRAALARYSITEVPTTLRPDGRSHPPHLRTWRDGWRHLRFLLVFAPKPTLLVPGLMIACAGLLGTALLVPGERRAFGVSFDVGALVYSCLAVLVGVQLLIFGGFARLYGVQEGITREDKHARWTRWLSFERCVTAGLLVGLGGLADTLVAVTDWGSTGFGALDPRETLRAVVPSATAIALGVILIFSGLFASLLSLRTSAERGGAPGASGIPSPRPTAETSPDPTHRP
ncbi:glycosyltransferase family 2 protein [Dactylosporangium aurantiacum]|uniref:Glycosyltransferase family 2 protein n=1 Tax=Dactylosporangium aurantiacum TaxID=35754 RepID=A0A9Q9IQ91_9ACTN|nr:glycosyltransferase family 2 protein [Dactylosporangium aurantiacum]MDG6110131.1 glycosyltransferase family 2 protein [Dactylosporangium aurantiacum]UWZ57877.1 glycosyltransferase family 2 protein [Dactylosporangium aurantiacum]